MSPEIRIQFAEGAEDIGLAIMLHDLMSQNIEQNPHKLPVFKKLDIPVGLSVTDVDIELTLKFCKGVLTIHPGILPSTRLNITAESDTIMNLSNQKIKWGLPFYFDETGWEIVAAIKSGRLKIKGMVGHFPSLLRLSRVMSVHG
jgi:hypothetical protein